MEDNLERAANATGELTKQSDIYQESWLAAHDRLKNALQGFYDQLLDDKFFIGLTN
jgi:hypothetical protein